MSDFYPYIMIGVYVAAGLFVAYYLGRYRGQDLERAVADEEIAALEDRYKHLYTPERDSRGRFVKR